MQPHIVNLFIAGILFGLAFAMPGSGIIVFLLAMLNLAVYGKYSCDNSLHESHYKFLHIKWR